MVRIMKQKIREFNNIAVLLVLVVVAGSCRRGMPMY